LIAELFADEIVDEQALSAARDLAMQAKVDLVASASWMEALSAWAVQRACENKVSWQSFMEAPEKHCSWRKKWWKRQTVNQPRIIRDLVENPFQQGDTHSSWLPRDKPEIVQMANGIYWRNLFDGLSNLADELLRAGCKEKRVVDHCRFEGPHVKGCWVLDGILGKQ